LRENTAAIPKSPTPILDRQDPLPSLAIRGYSAGILIGLGVCVVIAITTAATLWHPSSVPSLRQQLAAKLAELFPARLTITSLVSLGLTAFMVAFAAVAVHEVGHAVGGLLAGFRFRSLRIGPLVIHRGFRISRHSGWGAWLGGATQTIPVSSDKLASRAMVLVCAGPAASILAGCAVLILPTRGLPVWLFAIASTIGGLADLVPWRTPITVSDGARIWMLLKRRAQGERWLARLRLSADLTEGVPPESLPADYIAKAIAVCDDSPDTVIAHSVAYSAAFNHRRDADAGHLLETCLRFSSSVTPAVREVLMSDAAVFQARRRQCADLADAWLTQISAAKPFLWLRLRAQAAVCQAKGDFAGAVGKLDEYETAISALPNPTQREMLLRGLRRWRSELSGVTRIP
jgi:hypothetical protein